MSETHPNEIEEIISFRKDNFVVKNFPQVQRAYNEQYDWPELDILRHEICLCLLFGLFQASITLSNHFLESLLKLSLTVQHLFKNRDKPNTAEAPKNGASFIDDIGISSTKYNKLNLYNTIKLAAKEGLIDPAEEKQLDDFRERFRNAFSHADKSKMFGDARVKVTPTKLEDEQFKVEEPIEALIASTTFIQSIAQVQLAEEMAIPYFLYLDRLTRIIQERLKPKST